MCGFKPFIVFLLITNRKSLLMMLRMFQFINHGGRIILYRDMTVPHNVHNHVILSQTDNVPYVLPVAYPLPERKTPSPLLSLSSGTSDKTLLKLLLRAKDSRVLHRNPLIASRSAINNEPAPPTIRKRLTPAFFTPSIIVR